MGLRLRIAEGTIHGSYLKRGGVASVLDAEVLAATSITSAPRNANARRKPIHILGSRDTGSVL
jgi:hypothetical protein